MQGRGEAHGAGVGCGRRVACVAERGSQDGTQAGGGAGGAWGSAALRVARSAPIFSGAGGRGSVSWRCGSGALLPGQRRRVGTRVP
jgi:hypothetical protein